MGLALEELLCSEQRRDVHANHPQFSTKVLCNRFEDILFGLLWFVLHIVGKPDAKLVARGLRTLRDIEVIPWIAIKGSQACSHVYSMLNTCFSPCLVF